jgi:hypothetical protein
VVGRELILQVGIGGGAAGLRTDIDVVANATSGTDRAVQQVRAVIEVKGSWNPEVLTALHDQLVAQYLEPHAIRYGLYLVGDFTCELWTQSPGKSRSVALGGRVALSAELARQAQAATNGIREVRARVLDTSLPAQTR